LLEKSPVMSKLSCDTIWKEEIMDTMEVSKVRNVVKEKGTSSVTVTILKSNGTQRVINGVFKPTNDIKLDESLTKEGRIPIYCLTDNAWRSFKEHRVLEIA
jgi:hypothetical protein